MATETTYTLVFEQTDNGAYRAIILEHSEAYQVFDIHEHHSLDRLLNSIDYFLLLDKFTISGVRINGLLPWSSVTSADGRKAMRLLATYANGQYHPTFATTAVALNATAIR